MNTGLLLDLLAAAAVFSGILVITAKNPVISVVFLISVFINVAGYLVLIGVTYLGLVYIIVYVGAIAILFLFVIMMLNLRLVELDDTGKAYTQNIPAGTMIGALFFFLLGGAGYANSLSGSTSGKGEGVATTLYDNIVDTLFFWSSTKGMDTYNVGSSGHHVHLVAASPYGNSAEMSTIELGQVQSIGIGLYTHGSLWLAITSLILLLSMVGPIVLCIAPARS